jgi:hypothetical protein
VTFWLSGGIVQKTQALDGLLAFRVRIPGQTWVIVLADGRTGVVQTGEFRAACRDAPTGPGALALRHWLGARVVDARPNGTLLLEPRPKGASAEEPAPPSPPRVVSVREPSGRAAVPPAAATAAPPGKSGATNAATLDGGTWDRSASLRDGEALLASWAEGSMERQRHVAAHAVATALGRIDRRERAIQGDLARMSEARDRAERAAMFVAAAATAPRGATELVATDYTVTPPALVQFPLSPASPARTQLEAIFRRAKRLRDAEPRVRARHAATSATAETLRAIASELSSATTTGVLAELLARAKAAAPQDVRAISSAAKNGGKHGRASGATRLPYRRFLGSRGGEIWVGRGGKDNDMLTLHVAKPWHTWLHAKDQQGAHVVVPHDRHTSCPPDLLVEAAHLAAHFSHARGQNVTDIQVCERRHLRKPKGSPPGFVVVTKERVMGLRHDPDLLARVLGGENPE